MSNIRFAELEKFPLREKCSLISKSKVDKIILSYKEKNTDNNSNPYYFNDKTLGCKSFFECNSLEERNPNDLNTHSGHRMFDLHGFTTNGAEKALRRIFTSVDRSRQQIIKINVGQGSHSIDKKGKLPDVVRKVAYDLNLPPPIKHEKNPGYLLMILPPIITIE